MSQDFRDLYYYSPLNNNNNNNNRQYGSNSSATSTFPYLNNNSFTYNNNNTKSTSIDGSSVVEDIQMLDPSYMRFGECLQESTDYNTLEGAFSDPFGVVKDEPKLLMDGGHEITTITTPVTPNSSISSSSTEAGGVGDEDTLKDKKDKHEKESVVVDDGGESPKKENKQKKKGEKKQQQPRFAFMTKTEVDHLEDGYRWRKYGQKAVKNSPYPRSYYRCTTQKCSVKKRVERSFQDPTIVITTYEGQHNHHVPTNLRGNVAGMLSPSLLAPSPLMAAPSFHQDLMLQMPQYMYNNGGGGTTNTMSMYQQQTLNPLPQQTLIPLQQQTLIPPQQHQQLQFNDYGLLQDVIPSMFRKEEKP